FAYLKTLPPVVGRARKHELAFPFSVRRLLGVWKLLFLHGGPYMPDPAQSARWNRGAYLVNGPGHCPESPTPPTILAPLIDSHRFAGGPARDGRGWVPTIRPTGLQHWGEDDTAWSAEDIASYLSDGMDPSGDYAGSAMAEVIRNTALLSADDRAAIAAYIA